MKILVTGSEGFIGKLLVQELRKKPLSQVYEYDIKNSYPYGDQWFDHRYDVIYHLGAISDTREKDKAKIYRYNVDYTQRLIEHAARHSTFISFASSASVYGKSELNFPFAVGDKLNPDSLYAMSKVTGEYLLRFSDVRHNVLRLFNVYSTDGFSEAHKVGYSSPHHKFLTQNPIQIFEGSDSIRRDFIHVSDVINTFIEKTGVEGTFNVGTGKTTSFLDVARQISEKTGARIEEIPFPEELRPHYQFYTRATLS